MYSSQIITGEKLQDVADVFIGNANFFNYNPYIASQIQKHKYIADFDSGKPYNNPRIVFCYGDLISEFSKIMNLFMNPFVLITHNSDRNIVDDDIVTNILNHELLLRWHAQNVGHIHHTKLHFIPIGIANRQWPHGNLEMFEYIFKNYDLSVVKKKWAYMNFKIDTNREKRMKCYEQLFDKIPFLQLTNPMDNLLKMMEYRYCICPEGNGLDTHRLWECFYLRIIPVMLYTPFSMNIRNKTGFPMILLKSWTDFKWSDKERTVYEEFDFDKYKDHISLNYYIRQIIE